MNKLSQELTTTEVVQLENHEAAIKAGLQTFYEVGNALLAIRDARLYRRDFNTFEDYCRTRWGMAASRARQLIGAAGVAANLESVTSVTLSNEAQARALASFAADAQQVVWDYAVNTAPVVDDKPMVTAAHIKKAGYTVEILKQNGWSGDIQPGRALLIDPEFHGQMPPMEEFTLDAIEDGIVRGGRPINPLDVWGNTLVDGHARYFICMKHGLPFEVTQRSFESRQEAIVFILTTHLYRKSYSSQELSKIYDATHDDSLLPFIQHAEELEAQETTH
jgi:hypothetical protein